MKRHRYSIGFVFVFRVICCIKNWNTAWLCGVQSTESHGGSETTASNQSIDWLASVERRTCDELCWGMNIFFFHIILKGVSPCLVSRSHFSARPKRFGSRGASGAYTLASDTSLKWINREGLWKRRTGTRQCIPKIIERLRVTFTANGKRQIQVENFSE